MSGRLFGLVGSGRNVSWEYRTFIFFQKASSSLGCCSKVASMSLYLKCEDRPDPGMTRSGVKTFSKTSEKSLGSGVK